MGGVCEQNQVKFEKLVDFQRKLVKAIMGHTKKRSEALWFEEMEGSTKLEVDTVKGVVKKKK